MLFLLFCFSSLTEISLDQRSLEIQLDFLHSGLYVSILIAGGLFGIPGMLLGVPTFAVIYYIISMVVNRKLRKKQLPTDTDSYDEQGYVQADGSYVHMEENILKEKGDEPYADSSTK